jgi:hypothetical protein
VLYLICILFSTVELLLTIDGGGVHTIKIAVTTAHKIKSSVSAFNSRCWVTGLKNGCSSEKFSLGVSWILSCFTLNY